MTRPTHARRAVTLLELLVTVAATILLTGILLVTIRGVRGQSLVMRDLNNLRLSTQDILHWTLDNGEQLLNAGPPDSPHWQRAFPHAATPPNTTNPAPGSDWSPIYWSQQTGWNRVLASLTDSHSQHWQSAYGLREFQRPSVPLPAGANWPEPPRPGSMLYAIHPTRFLYAATLLSSAELWEDRTDLPTGAHTLPYLTPVRLSDIRHPAGKGVLIHLHANEESNTHHASFIDGSAEARAQDRFREASLIPGVPNRVRGVPIAHTLHGHHGRDR